MKKFRLKNYTALKIKIFNFNRLIVLLISGIIIFCIRYYLNYFGYVTDISLIFIFLCVLLKSIIQAIVEYIREPNLIIKNGKSNDKRLKDIHTYTIISSNINNNDYSNANIYTDADINYLKSKYNSYNNKFSNENIESYLSHIEDIHISISSGKLNYAINLDQVDQFFKNLAIQEEDRHLNRLKELKQNTSITELLQQLLYDEEVVFKNRMNLIEQDRLIHIKSLRINGLRYTNEYEYINNDSNVTRSDNKNVKN